jgi:hypothetical protein
MCQFIHVLSTHKEGLDAQLLEPQIWLRIDTATHDTYHFRGELEGRALEGDSTRGDVEAESKIYLHY